MAIELKIDSAYEMTISEPNGIEVSKKKEKEILTKL